MFLNFYKKKVLCDEVKVFVRFVPASTPPSVSMNTLVEAEKAEPESAKNSPSAAVASSNRLSSLQRWLNYESNHKLNSDPVAIPVCKEVGMFID